MAGSLNEDWMERIAESPKLMLEIIKILRLREVHENKLWVIKRMEAGTGQWHHRGNIDAIALEVDTEVLLKGVGLYGAMDNTKFKVHVKVFLNDDCLLEETKEYTSKGSASPVEIIFSSSVKVEPNRRYDITTLTSGGDTLKGTNPKEVIQSNGTNPFNVTFFDSPLDQNNTRIHRGQIPVLYFKAPFM